MPAGRVTTPASWRLPVNREQVEMFVNIVTDDVPTLTDVDKDGKPMASVTDIVRLAPEKVAACDAVWNFIDNPIPMGNQREGYGHDGDRFVPISLQYQPYTADGPHVRRHSIANYPAEDHNYFGQTSQMFNGTDYDGVAYSRQAVDASGKNIPVGFGVSDEAYADILMGNAEPQGLLPMQQPKDMDTVEAQLEDVPRDMECYTDSEGHTYDFAYGLNWKGVIHDARIARYDVPVLHKK